MPLIISECYEIVTPESAEYGDAEEMGFTFEDREFTLRELVDYIESKGYSQTSDYPACADSWLSTYPQIEDYSTCEEVSYSLHPKRGNARTMRYWEKALRHCGFLK